VFVNPRNGGQEVAIEEAKVGNVAIGLMEQRGDYGDDATIDHVMVIAAVHHPGGDIVHFAVSEAMPNYVGIGLLRKVQTHLEAAGP
jgi:hypothetical protein